MEIENATPQHSLLIADAIIEAVGSEFTNKLAEDKVSIKEIHNLFQRLAERNDSQYSYKNSHKRRWYSYGSLCML
ncbi:MAG: hypothetical protein HDS41_01510 [Bacteroides sp.]|nr:hypothetical protein [Bacteroides sp.]